MLQEVNFNVITYTNRMKSQGNMNYRASSAHKVLAELNGKSAKSSVMSQLSQSAGNYYSNKDDT